MRTPKAILFDLDDTIISFDGISGQVWIEVCSAFVDEHNPPFGCDTLLKKLGETRKWYWSDPERGKAGRANLIEARRQVFAETLKGLDFYNEAISNETADRYSRLHEESLCLLPGAYEALETIRSLGIRMALITNGTALAQRGKLERFNLTRFFECVLIDEETGFSKPDVRMYRLALDRMALSHTDCWMVGDNLIWDVQGAQNAAIFAVWNDYRKKGLPKGSKVIPDRIIHSIHELIGYLEKTK